MMIRKQSQSAISDRSAAKTRPRERTTEPNTSTDSSGMNEKPAEMRLHNTNLNIPTDYNIIKMFFWSDGARFEFPESGKEVKKVPFEKR